METKLSKIYAIQASLASLAEVEKQIGIARGTLKELEAKAAQLDRELHGMCRRPF